MQALRCVPGARASGVTQQGAASATRGSAAAALPFHRRLRARSARLGCAAAAARSTTACGARARCNMRAWRREEAVPSLTLFAPYVVTCPQLRRRRRSGAARSRGDDAVDTNPRVGEARAGACAQCTADALGAAQPVDRSHACLRRPGGRRRPRRACTESRCVGCRRRTARQARRKASTLPCSLLARLLFRLCCTRRKTRCAALAGAAAGRVDPRAFALTLYAR